MPSLEPSPTLCQTADGKTNRLTFGAYPEVYPAQARRDEKQAQTGATMHTFEAVARAWLKKTSATRAATTQGEITTWLQKDVFPSIGNMPVSKIKPLDVLKTVQKMEARGAVDSAHRVKQICGQVMRYSVATGLVERDVTADLKGALAAVPKTNYAAITEPKQAGDLMRSIFAYTDYPCAVAALKLSPLLFVRPGELRAAEWAEIDLDAAESRP